MAKGKSKTRGAKSRSSGGGQPALSARPEGTARPEGWTAGLFKAIVVGIASGLGTGFVQVPATLATTPRADASERATAPAEPRAAAPPRHRFLVEVSGVAGTFQKRVTLGTSNPYSLWQRASGKQPGLECAPDTDCVAFEVSESPDGLKLQGKVERDRLVQYLMHDLELTTDQQRLIRGVSTFRVSRLPDTLPKS